MRASEFPRFVSRLDVGGLTVASRVFLAPMSGVTDAPFRRLAARLGAGLVVSEMTACAALAAGKRDAKLRVEAPGTGYHVVQIAGCEAKWMARGLASWPTAAPPSSISTWAARRGTSPMAGQDPR